MVSVRLQNFEGTYPGRSKRLLPDNASQKAVNVKVFSGELRPYRQPQTEHILTSPYIPRTVFRAKDEGGSVYMTFEQPHVNVLRSPLVNDLYKRFYIFGADAPQVAKFDDLMLGNPARPLGVPIAGTAPVVTPVPPPDPQPDPPVAVETRYYVYTYVTDMGEEGMPSPPSATQSGIVGGWGWPASPTRTHSIPRRRTLPASMSTGPSAAAPAPASTGSPDRWRWV